MKSFSWNRAVLLSLNDQVKLVYDAFCLKLLPHISKLFYVHLNIVSYNFTWCANRPEPTLVIWSLVSFNHKFSNHIQMNQEWIVAKCTVSPSLAFSIWKFLLSEFIYKFYINCVSIQFYPGLLPDFRVANQNNWDLQK